MARGAHEALGRTIVVLLSALRRGQPSLLPPCLRARPPSLARPSDVCSLTFCAPAHTHFLPAVSNPDSSSSSSPTGTVALVSSDNVRFYIDRAKLERESDAFPPADAQLAPGETVPLTEDGDTLELLLRFVDREEYVNLDDVEFSLLARLAEAAQKYRVYSAMSLCRVFMRAQHDKHPVEVLVYALKHGHDDIVDLAAPHTVGTPCSEMHAAMPSTSHYIAWVRLIHLPRTWTADLMLGRRCTMTNTSPSLTCSWHSTLVIIATESTGFRSRAICWFSYIGVGA
ncbi:hypothetical protein BD626DRAFT_614570 [Schizophyllum amplum]|uniref:BTB domain-containing protein n=1 Tax=Schizophyllum amplum TaxID=97359 RepID=A0A550BYT8_9AGAR|nr:hypothetical protein BD626DRAFT_614570 [Auriculariopsis ampla]